MKTNRTYNNRTYRLPTLEEFRSEINNIDFNYWYYTTSDVIPEIENSVVLYNPLDKSEMIEDKFQNNNLRLVFEENGELFWRVIDEIKESSPFVSDCSDSRYEFTFSEAEERICNLNAEYKLLCEQESKLRAKKVEKVEKIKKPRVKKVKEESTNKGKNEN